MGKRIAVCVLCLLMAGCSVLQPPTRPVQQTYTLRLTVPIPARLQPRGAILQVDEPLARAGLDSPRMVYLRDPYSHDFFAQSQWADNPSRLLHPLLMTVMEGSGGFAAVVAAGSGVHTPLRLDTELLAFEQDFTADRSRMRIALRVQLVDTVKSTVLYSNVYAMDEGCPSEDARGGVVAANLILDRLLPRIAADVAAQSR